MADEPMSDERLAEIRRMASRAEVSMMASSDVAVRDLLAEVERLRAREAAAMAIVRAVATKGVTMYDSDGTSEARMTPEIVDAARALLAQE